MPDDEGNWFDGFDVCEQAGGRYATPPTGFQNRLLGAAGADAGAVWLNYQSLDGGWVVGLNAPPTVALASRGPTTPTTGGGVALVAAMLLLPLAARAARRPV